MTTASEFGQNINVVGKETKGMPVFLCDAGHGGIIDGEYQTKGKRSPLWHDGRQLFEGEFNRCIVKRLIKLMSEYGVPHINLVDSEQDVPLKKRTDDANDYYNKVNKNCIYLSIHANAASSDKATGFEVFTSPEYTGKSDDYAEIIFEEYKKGFPELKARTDKSDGDSDREENFWVLSQTKMPAILIECAFMTTLNPDCELLMSEEGRDRIATAIFKAILRICESQKN
jgi:N-acetylmuramoyl-L-alanine amidase